MDIFACWVGLLFLDRHTASGALDRLRICDMAPQVCLKPGSFSSYASDPSGSRLQQKETRFYSLPDGRGPAQPEDLIKLGSMKDDPHSPRLPLPEHGVKLKSLEQRAPLPGDPVCVICGQYGEYICDETDDDICSLQCKQTLLTSLEGTHAGPSSSITFPATDECFYVKDSGLSLNPDDHTQVLRDRLEIHVKGGTVPPPALFFHSTTLHPQLLVNLETAGYDIPTPIQMQAIPAALIGKDLIVSADAGSGKTASFLIPIVSRCASFRSDRPADHKRPLAIVLAPTRELCIQIEEEAKILGKGLPFKTALVVGGDPLSGQVYRIQQGTELVIGTPGRLIDILTKHDIELDDVMMFVLDEVDCMLQRGFRDQVLQIFRALSQPQVLLYSATVSPEVEKVAGSLAKDIIAVSVGKPNRPSKAVKQLAIWVDSKQKKQKLFEILSSKNHFKPPAVVYVNSRVGADLLASAITVATGIKALSIHGQKSMKERRDAMNSFLVGEVSVLVSTGVLGRGVDLLKARQVIVFDMPNTVEEYVHEIGRASRMGGEGSGILFVNEENRNVFPELVEALRSAGAAIPRELANSKYTAAGSFASRRGYNRKRKFGH